MEKTKDLEASCGGDKPHVQMARLLGPIAESGDVAGFLSIFETDPYLCMGSMALISTVNTPLHVAVRMGHLGLVRAILDRIPHLAHRPYSDGLSLIHRAVEKGHVEIVRELLSRDPHLFYHGDSHGRAPLHCAAALGKHEVVEALIEFAGSNLGDDGMDLRTHGGETALHLAVKNMRRKTLATMLLMLDPPEAQKKLLLNEPDHEGKTVLQLAYNNNMYKIIESPELYEEVDNSGWVGLLYKFIQQYIVHTLYTLNNRWFNGHLLTFLLSSVWLVSSIFCGADSVLFKLVMWLVAVFFFTGPLWIFYGPDTPGVQIIVTPTAKFLMIDILKLHYVELHNALFCIGAAAGLYYGDIQIFMFVYFHLEIRMVTINIWAFYESQIRSGLER